MSKGDPYSRLTDGMKYKQDPDDDPSKLPDQEDKEIYGQYLSRDRQIQNATPDVSARTWGCEETYRRLNSRGK